MNILIPMAGRGQRFKDEGYDKPKPMIDVNGLPMIQRVIKNINPRMHDRMIFLCLKSFLDKYGDQFKAMLPPIASRVIIPVDRITQGAACTALLAKEYINNEEPLLITDCDHIVNDDDHLRKGVEFFKRNKCEGGLWCHLADNPKWSYTRVHNGIAVEIVEKRVISDLANTGDYYFHKGSTFVEQAELMIHRGDKTRGEFYVAPVLTYLIAYGAKVMPYVVNEMIGLGTPSDLKYYEQNLYKYG